MFLHLKVSPNAFYLYLKQLKLDWIQNGLHNSGESTERRAGQIRQSIIRVHISQDQLTELFSILFAAFSNYVRTIRIRQKKHGKY